ncbi:tripartite tricarboxylate transporter TctB family protein [Saccharopolyspora sp. 5N708]|uniref:tripartite tricarboxylate transporter TctB family protein n=1 Tax=Saccharopolyspora sp. 5N708 TaxID=3457424 RepID=UPI003FD16A6E
MLRQRWRELTTAAAFALLAVVFLVGARDLAFEARGIPGPGLFPVLVAVATLAFSAALAGTALVSKNGAESEPVAWRRPAFGCAALLGCSLLMSLVGFVAAMVLLVGLLLLGMERRRDRVSIISVVAVPVAFYVLFAVLLDVRLPDGPFG